jgi:HAD superfamily hydrolase (TIGR01509 family)
MGLEHTPNRIVHGRGRIKAGHFRAATRWNTVVFDVDGTLIDSNDAHARAYVEALREHGRTIDPLHVRRLIGMGGDKVLPEIADVAEQSELGQAIARRKKELFDSLLPDLQPTRGARALVQYLRDADLTLVIATSAGGDELHALLERAGVADLFPARTSKDDAPSSKPEPDIVAAALAKVDADPSTTVMIGDTPYDIEAAARAGIETIALRCGGYWTDDKLAAAVAIFDDPAALLEQWRDNHVPVSG